MPDVQAMTMLPAGRELDNLVAERVMGWMRADPHALVSLNWNTPTGTRTWELTSFGSFQPSTDIAAAWEVVERMRSHNNPRYCNLSLVAYAYNRTYATFDATGVRPTPPAFADYDAATWVEANGEHATPLAICRAALKAVTFLSGAAATPHETEK